MNENITLRERALVTRDFCDKHLQPVFSECGGLSTEAQTNFVNSIAFALNDEQPLLATAEVTGVRTGWAKFVIFTKTRVLYFLDKCESLQRPEILVFPRRTLKGLTILGSAAVIDTGGWLDDQAQYRLNYANGIMFDLTANHSSPEMHEAINGCLPALYADLEG